MKKLILMIASVGISGCLSSGGDSAPAAKIAEPISAVPTTTVPAVGNTDLSISDLSSKTITSSAGNLIFGSNQVIDQECLFTFDVVSSSQIDSSTVELRTAINPPSSYGIYSHQSPCAVPLTITHAYINVCTHLIAIGLTVDYPYFITYRLEKLPSGMIEVTKTAESRHYRILNCNLSNEVIHFDTMTVPVRNYSQ
ncbi:MAG: hypothetical protein ACK5RO_01355 [Pseudobdellovibrionaceae bacterium]|nr:hypothetical protein [Pseudanabaena sp. M151S2SP2A07QC]